MKKTMMFLGVLSLGLAHAQQYDGKVGVNTHEPTATLEIKAYMEDGSRKEGLLIPRMSKANLAKIADPTVSTLIYVNEATTYTAGTDANADNRVTNVDAVGFYHYNGTQWVKHIDTDTNTSIWTKLNKDIALIDADLDNTIKYTTEGQYWNIPKTLRKVSDFDTKTLAVKTVPIDFNSDIKQIGQAGVINLGYADKLFTSNTSTALWKGKKLSNNFLLVDEQNDGTAINRLYTQQNSLHINENATKNYSALYVQVNEVEHYGSGTAGLLIGTYNNAGVIKGTATRLVGAFNQVGTRATTTSDILESTYNFANPRSSSRINGLYGTRNHIVLNQFSSNNVGNAIGSNNHIQVTHNFEGTIDRLMGNYVSFDDVRKETGIKEMYGLKITDVNKADELLKPNEPKDDNNNYTKNYAIHTGQGKVKLGDNTMIKTDIIAPTSSLTVQGNTASGMYSNTMNRALFTGASGGANGAISGTYVGFGAYTDLSDLKNVKYKTTIDNASPLKNRFFLINNATEGKFHFSPFIAADGKVEEEFNPVDESALTIVHEGKKVGIGTNNPREKLEVAGAVKIGTTDTNCTTTNAGIIRFDATAKKFQGCTGDAWVDLH